MERIDTRERMEEIFNKLSSKTLEALEKEKGNHISRRTEKMITLCYTLYEKIMRQMIIV